MLSEKQFRERAKSELRQIGSRVRTLATDRDLYRKLEREVVQPNPQLCEARSDFLEMVRAAYTDAMTARVLHLLEGEDESASLPRLLAQLAEHAAILQDKITESEFANDRGALERAARNLKHAAAPRFARHERTLPALAAAHRELDATLDLMIETVKTYYWIVSGSYIDLEVRFSDDPLSIFQSPWVLPGAGEVIKGSRLRRDLPDGAISL